MSSIVASATQLLAPWAHLYDDSKVVSTGVTFAHIGGLLLGGGCAIASDRMTLRFHSSDPVLQRSHLDELAATHRPVLIGLAVTLVSGLLQLGADLTTFLGSLVFWGKMVVVVTLLLNGMQLRRAELALRREAAQPDRSWSRLRRAAKTSLVLWFGATLLGTALLAI